jgi:hypothetical protein
MSTKLIFDRLLASVIGASVLILPKLATAQSGTFVSGQSVGTAQTAPVNQSGAGLSRLTIIRPGPPASWTNTGAGSASYYGRGSGLESGQGAVQSRGPADTRPESAGGASTGYYFAGPPVRRVYSPYTPPIASAAATTASPVPSRGTDPSGSYPNAPQANSNSGGGWNRAPARNLPQSDSYIYTEGNTVVIPGTPVLLGGYYYANYCDTSTGENVYPSIYSTYDGGPQFIYNPGVIVLSQPQYPVYDTPYASFTAPPYQVTYNENNYYVTEEDQAQQIEQGGAPAKAAVKSAFAEGSYQAAFADIERAWTDGDSGLIRKHLRDADTKISVLMKKQYAYSIASDDFADITRDAIHRLDTISFKFTRLRKADDGDVTAYGVHVYRATKTGETADADSKSDKTEPFDADAPADTPASTTDPATDDVSPPAATDAATSDPAPSEITSDAASISADGSAHPAKSASGGSKEVKTVYVSYTLRKGDDQWYIVIVDSSPNKLATDQDSVQ